MDKTHERSFLCRCTCCSVLIDVWRRDKVSGNAQASWCHSRNPGCRNCGSTRRYIAVLNFSRKMPTYYSSWLLNDSFQRPSNFCSFSNSLFDVMWLTVLNNHKKNPSACPESQILWREVLCEKFISLRWSRNSLSWMGSLRFVAELTKFYHFFVFGTKWHQFKNPPPCDFFLTAFNLLNAELNPTAICWH